MTATPYGSTPDAEPRGTEGMAFGQTIDAEAYYNAPVTETPAEASRRITENAPEQPTGEVKDDVPALEGVGAEYAGEDADETEGVDVASLPAFKDLRTALPSQRLKAKMDAAKVATSLPSHLKNGEAKGLDFETMTSDDLDALTNLFSTMEKLVIDNAADPEAMTAWLVAQDEPLNAVMVAFQRFTAYMGN